MNPKQILVLKGSPRIKGNSSILADRAAAGARESGAQVEVFDLHRMNIQPCSACEACHIMDEGNCNIEDDMQQLYPRLRKADGIVIASPVYWFTISAQAKLCIDRWYALEEPHGNALAGKKFGIILTYGDTNLQTSGGINAVHTFESMFKYLHCELLEVVHGSASKAGEIEQCQDLMNKAFELGKKLVSSQ